MDGQKFKDSLSFIVNLKPELQETVLENKTQKLPEKTIFSTGEL